MDYRLVHKMNLSRGNAIAGVCDAGRVMSRSETTSNNSPYNPQMGAVRQTSACIGTGVSILFYKISNERHSDKAASRLSLNVLRFESDLCELK